LLRRQPLPGLQRKHWGPARAVRRGFDVSITLDLPDALVEQIAERVAVLLAERAEPKAEPWLTVEQAAAHLGISTSQLYTLASRRRRNGVPLTKEGARSYFRASELDRWRESGGGR
jgi:predicted DNA-binding transcriptional regulator AlpA